MAQAKGKYIALCEGDDYWTDPLKLQKQVDFLERNSDCIACHHWQEYAFPKESGKYKVQPAPTTGQGYLPRQKATVKEIFANQLRIKTRTVLYRNIGLMDLPDWYYKINYGDVALSMIFGKYGIFGFINEPMAVYRQTGDGVSTHDKNSYFKVCRHNINWIEIWEYGIHHFKYEYWKEAKQTILSFYNQIIKHYKGNRSIISKVVGYSLIRSKLRIAKRIVVATIVLGYILNEAKLRTKIKVKKILVGNE
jgi:hypothetical protein